MKNKLFSYLNSIFIILLLHKVNGQWYITIRRIIIIILLHIYLIIIYLKHSTRESFFLCKDLNQKGLKTKMYRRVKNV